MSVRSRSDPPVTAVFESFEGFVAQYWPSFYRTAVLLTGERGLAEDLVQSALLRVANRWFVAKRNPTAYTRKVLTNLHHNAYRDSQRRPRETTAELAAEPQAEERGESDLDDRDWIKKGLALLPLRQRQVIILRFYEDLSVAETAAALGTSEGTVKAHTARACENLRQLLAQSELEENHAD